MNSLCLLICVRCPYGAEYRLASPSVRVMSQLRHCILSNCNQPTAPVDPWGFATAASVVPRMLLSLLVGRLPHHSEWLAFENLSDRVHCVRVGPVQQLY